MQQDRFRRVALLLPTFPSQFRDQGRHKVIFQELIRAQEDQRDRTQYRADLLCNGP